MALTAFLLAAQVYTGISSTPPFKVTVEESKSAQCIGNGYDQKVTIEMGEDRFVIEDRCANEGFDEKDEITVYRNGELCSCPTELARTLYPQAVKIAWEQNAPQYLQTVIRQIKTTVETERSSIHDKTGRVTRGLNTKVVVPHLDVMRSATSNDNGVQRDGFTRYVVQVTYLPADLASGKQRLKRDLYLSYAHGEKENAIVLYEIEHQKKDAVVRAYYDVSSNGTLDGVVIMHAQTFGDRVYFDKAIDQMKKGNLKARKPTPEEKRFYERYVQDLALGRIVF